MKWLRVGIAAVLFHAIAWSFPALAVDQGSVVAVCGTVPTAYPAGTPQSFTLDVNGNLCVIGTFVVTPSGTQNVNLTQILGAAPSATNPLWVLFGTGATLPAFAAIPAFKIDQTTPGTTNGVALVGVNGATALAGAGAVGTGSARVAVGQDTTTIAGSNPGRTYNTVAASQTAQALTGGGGGATGDYLSHCIVIPTSTSPGVVTILDNAVSVVAFPGGASSLSNLVPFTIPVGSYSVSGAWKVTTGANMSVMCAGKFT